MKKAANILLVLGAFLVVGGVIWNVAFVNRPEKVLGRLSSADKSMHREVSDYVIWAGVVTSLFGTALYTVNAIRNYRKTQK